MAKIHPQASISPLPSSSPSPYTTSGQEAFTIWMKSLVFNSNGCTVFDSKGRIVYRVDNYDCKCNDEVYLMDLSGKLVFAILRKKLRVFGRWEGFKCKGSMVEHGKPWFQVRKPYRILKRDLNCEVTVGCSEIQPIHYRLEGSPGKASCKIVDRSGAVVAEVKQKFSTSGVVLGDDVLSLVVEPNIDHSVIMALVIVYSLVNSKM